MRLCYTQCERYKCAGSRFRYFKIIWQKPLDARAKAAINVETVSIDIDCDAITDGDAGDADAAPCTAAGRAKYECARNSGGGRLMHMEIRPFIDRIGRRIDRHTRRR